MRSNGLLIDGSWNLFVQIPNIGVQTELRVRGVMSVGELMFKVVESAGVNQDWSDYLLWNLDKKQWLTRNRFTLDQYEVTSNSKLHFTTTHKNAFVLLPNHAFHKFLIDFSSSVFNVVELLCKRLDIRYNEELSLQKVYNEYFIRSGKMQNSKKHLPQTQQMKGFNHTKFLATSSSSHCIATRNSFASSAKNYEAFSDNHSPRAVSMSEETICPKDLYTSSMYSVQGNGNKGGTGAASSYNTPSYFYRPKNLIEKARISCGWLDSSRCLMEQGVCQDDVLLFKFKYYIFHDINPKLDENRIDLLFEQAKNSILYEWIDCTEEEAMVFAALQLRAQAFPHTTRDHVLHDDNNNNKEDDIDAALNELETSLENRCILNPNDPSKSIPQLADTIKIFKGKKSAYFKTFKNHFCVLKNSSIFCYADEKRVLNEEQPLLTINLTHAQIKSMEGKNCLFQLQVNQARPISYLLKFSNDETKYVQWLAACKIICGASCTSSFSTQVDSIKSSLKQQQHPSNIGINDGGVLPRELHILPQNYLPAHVIRKHRNSFIISRIQQAYKDCSAQNLTCIQAMMQYIKLWQSLPDFGITYFIVKFCVHSKFQKDEILGISPVGFSKIETGTNSVCKHWRYSSMKTWSINWETGAVTVSFEDDELCFLPSSVSSYCIHNFIAGYTFLSLRSQSPENTAALHNLKKILSG